jgi:hypothetical protein
MPHLDLSAELLRPVGELKRETKTAGRPLGACYLSDEAELTIAAIAGDIQDRA